MKVEEWFEVYSEVSEFLSVLKPSTRNVYSWGLAAFRTFPRDRKVDPLYIEFWMGHAIPDQNTKSLHASAI